MQLCTFHYNPDCIALHLNTCKMIRRFAKYNHCSKLIIIKIQGREEKDVHCIDQEVSMLLIVLLFKRDTVT